MSTPAPIAIFAYRRPAHLARALESLQRCPEFAASPVYVYADGPRGGGDRADVEATRSLARERLGSAAEYRFATANRGLAPSVIAGVSELVERHGRVIVVEDDLELAPDFLAYQNLALDRYAADERVMQVSGHMYDVPELRSRTNALFLPFTTTWGWGTWQRAWRHFDADAPGWRGLAADKALRRRFNLDGVYDYASMLENQMSGRGSSWGIRWYWCVFRQAGLVVYPPVTRVRNTGFDGTGTHGRGTLRRFGVELLEAASPVTMPDEVEAEAEAFRAARRAVWRQNGGWLGHTLDRARRLRRRLTGARV